MKLFRFGKPGEEKPAVFLDDKKYDVSAFVDDYDEEFFSGGGIQQLQQLIRDHFDQFILLPANVRLGPPVVRPSKIICIGLNYIDHALETKSPVPKEPIIFFKSQTAICGPNDDVILPKNSIKTDWEVELAVVVGKKASYVPLEKAEEYIAGYLLHNDYSEREFQLERGGQWVKGKSCDTFAPLGPFLVTPDEIDDVYNLKMWLTVNGKMMQESSTGNMIFKVPFLIHYISQFMTLLPGDIISTGTPKGVGLGFNPPVYLKDGDVVELSIEGLGSAKQNIRSYQ